MKKILMAAALVAATVAANAQSEVGTFTLQPKVGLSLSNIAGEENNGLKAGFVAGVEGEYQVSPLIGLSAGLSYQMQGCTYDDAVVTVAGISNGGKDMKTSLEYINIPILANFYVAKNFALKVGIQPGFLVSAKSKGTAVALNNETDYDDDIKDGCKTFDFSIPVGASYQISDFVIDARYNWGLTNIYKDTNDSYRNSVFQLTVGYKFAL